MHSFLFSTSTIVVGLLAGSSQAFWRLSCSTVQTSRIDPIINPGALSPHAHVLAGASNVNQASTYDSLLQSNCTSCEIQDDKSAYWTPLLYYQHSNGTFEEVPHGGMTVYYEGRGDDMNLQPFPPGFRMVSGNPKARSYNQQKLIPGSDRPIADRVSFACLDSGSSKEQPGLVSTDCKNGLRAQIHFQSCWNGKDLYKPDNSHVEYMSGLDNGVCPPTHPVALMHLFFEVLYGVNDIKKDGGKFVFSQGDTTGFGFHGDFMNGWKPDVLASAVKQCGFTNDGAVEHCAPFKPSLDPDFSKNCPERPSLLNEPVHGTIDKLAGCITITSGPQDATDADMVCAGGHTAARKGVPSLDSSVNAVSKVTTVATSSHAKASATESSASIKAIGSSHEDSDDGDDSKKIRRDVAKGDPHGSDEYGYGYDFPPTPTHHHPSPPRGSPRPQRRHNKRAMPVAEDDPYSYTFEYPPLGSPAPRRRNSKRHAS